MSQHSAAQERREIVARYDRGRDDNAVIDSWEDPQREEYHKMDRYGFIHDQRLPVRNGNDNKKMVETEMKRVEKWQVMLKKWDTYSKPSNEKFRKRIYKGVPEKVRSDVWLRMLKVNDIKQQQAGVYKKMRDLARLHSPEIRQIDLDVNRTYRNNEIFRERYSVKQQALFHVLAAYSMYNTEVGYCQGMSQVAALLLMYMPDEEEAFWALSALLSDHKFAMHGFFIPGFPKLVRFQTLHESILKKYLPKIKKHIDKHDIHTNLYSVKWFFQCFLDRVPFHLCLRLWDVYLYEGERLLIAMAYNVFKLHARVILKRKSMESVIDLLQRELEQDFGYSDDEVMEKLAECMDELRRHKLDLPVSVDNELPTKPFGLLYHPTVGQVRRFVDSSMINERNSIVSSDEPPSTKQSNGHPPPNSSPSPQFVPAAVGHTSTAKFRFVSESDSVSRPTSRQLHSSTPSVYDNVYDYSRNNRVRPSERLPPSSSSPHRSPTEHPPSSYGDHRYVSVVHVSSEGGHDRLVGRANSVIEKSEMFTKEYTVSPPTAARSPYSPGQPKVTESQIVSQRDGLRTTGGGGGGISRYGSHIESQAPRNGRSSYLESEQNGGTTVIKIGLGM